MNLKKFSQSNALEWIVSLAFLVTMISIAIGNRWIMLIAVAIMVACSSLALSVSNKT